MCLSKQTGSGASKRVKRHQPPGMLVFCCFEGAFVAAAAEGPESILKGCFSATLILRAINDSPFDRPTRKKNDGHSSENWPDVRSKPFLL